MQFNDLVSSITPETFERLIQAVELGKWPDGVKLSDQQREHCIQLVMAYQAKYRPSEEAFRIGADGQLVTRTKRAMKADIKGEQTIASFSLNNSQEASS